MLSPSLSLLTFIVTFLLFSSTSFYFEKFLLTLIFSVELSLLPRLQSRSCIAFNCQVPLVHFNLKESPVFCFVLFCFVFVLLLLLPCLFTVIYKLLCGLVPLNNHHFIMVTDIVGLKKKNRHSKNGLSLFHDAWCLNTDAAETGIIWRSMFTM